MLGTESAAISGMVRSDYPHPPNLRFSQRPDSAAVVMAFNGTEYRAVLDLDGKGMCKSEDVAAMLVGLAGEIGRKR